MGTEQELDTDETTYCSQETVRIYGKVYTRKKHQDANGLPCKECNAPAGELHRPNCNSEICPACSNCLTICLRRLRQRLPYEQVLEELGYEHDDPDGLDTCGITQFIHPWFDLYLETDGVRLHRPMHAIIEDESNKQLLEFLNLFNAKATVTRFFIDHLFPDGYLRAEAVYHGEFDHGRFKAFAEHWFADILPIPDSISLGIKEEKLRRKKRSEEFWGKAKKVN